MSMLAPIKGHTAAPGNSTNGKKGAVAIPAKNTTSVMSSSTSPLDLIIAFQVACARAAASTASVTPSVSSGTQRFFHDGECAIQVAFSDGQRWREHEHAALTHLERETAREAAVKNLFGELGIVEFHCEQ